MPFPLIAVAAIASSALINGAWNAYQTHQSTYASDKAYAFRSSYELGASLENRRFWSDYIRRHHLEGREILYPYRTGYNYDLSKMYTADAALVNNRLNRTGSIVTGLTSGARGVSYLYPSN